MVKFIDLVGKRMIVKRKEELKQLSVLSEKRGKSVKGVVGISGYSGSRGDEGHLLNFDKVMIEPLDEMRVKEVSDCKTYIRTTTSNSWNSDKENDRYGQWTTVINLNAAYEIIKVLD